LLRSISAHVPSCYATVSRPWSGSGTSPGNQQPKAFAQVLRSCSPWSDLGLEHDPPTAVERMVASSRIWPASRASRSRCTKMHTLRPEGGNPTASSTRGGLWRRQWPWRRQGGLSVRLGLPRPRRWP
jgi:hypothetical protein